MIKVMQLITGELIIGDESCDIDYSIITNPFSIDVKQDNSGKYIFQLVIFGFGILTKNDKQVNIKHKDIIFSEEPNEQLLTAYNALLEKMKTPSIITPNKVIDSPAGSPNIVNDLFSK